MNDDLQTTQPAMVNLVNNYGLPMKEFSEWSLFDLRHSLTSLTFILVIDEYGVSAEQVPGGAAWWIARLERFNMYGMRGNWRSGSALQDTLASLLVKSGSTYSANGGPSVPGMLSYASYTFVCRVSSIQVLCVLDERVSRRHHWLRRSEDGLVCGC